MVPDANNPCTKANVGLLDTLRKFNAKERFYLVGHFLGNPKFNPDKVRLADLENKLQLPEDIFVKATDVFCAMDYHLDWLNGALECAFLNNGEGSRFDSHGVDSHRVTGTQEDIDLLLAFSTASHPKRYHIVLIEAKGVTSISNSQLESKLKRFDAIFLKDDDKLRFDKLAVHFILAVPPRQHPQLKWESKLWKDPKFLDLPMGVEKFLKITRVDDDYKPTKKNWSKWIIKTR